MKKTKKALASLAIAGMVMTMVPFNVFATGTVPTRLAGTTAAQTAVAIADQTGWTGTAILASSASYGMVDALTSGPLAKFLSAPILLQEPGAVLNADTKAELTKLNVKKVYVTSGTAVINQAVLDQLVTMGITVESLGGVDRFETSVNIAKKMVALGAPVTKVAVAYGWLNQDALSIASIASANNEPILLTEKNALPASAKAFLTANITSSDVIGGTAVISDAVKATLPNATRHAGNTAYDTNDQVIKDFASSLKFDNVFIANAVTGIDALAGAPLAAVSKSAIVLTDGVNVPAAATFVNSKLTSSSVVTALGGIAVVPESVRTGIVSIVPATLAVTSVSAINAKELTITFNQAVKESTVVNASGLLVAGVLKVDNIAVAGQIASLSSDGTVLTVQSASNWTGTHSAEVLKDSVLTETGLKVSNYATSFIFNDTTRASITGTTFVSKYTYKVNFSEPVLSTGTVAAQYADGSAVTLTSVTPATDGKSVTVIFDPLTTVNKEITVSFPALTDYVPVTPNISVPLTAKVTISNADTTKPVVTSVTPTSNTTLKVKFAEPIIVVSDILVSLNGTPLVAGNVVVNADDKTVLDITVPSINTAAPLTINAGAVEDLSLNLNAAFTQTVNFATDTVAPQVSSYKVVSNAGVNELDVTFSEEVIKVAATDLTLKYTDTYGVSQTVTVPTANVTVDATDKKLVKIVLQDTLSAAVKADVNYSVSLAAGYFTDNFVNTSALQTIAFLNTANATALKLALIAASPIVVTDATAGTATRANTGAFVDVQFANAVDITTATNAANYAVEGAQVSKAVLVYNNPTTPLVSTAKAVVRVYITDNTVTATGNYNVTVSGVKGYSSAVTVMDSVTKNIAIVENTRPTVTAVAVKSFVASTSTTVTLTFSEAITAIGGNTDFDLYVAGVKVSGATVTTGVAGTSIDFVINKDLSADLAASKEVKFVPTSGLDLTDANGNVANVTTVIVK